MEKLAGHTPANSMEVDASEDPAGAVRALVNDCKFTMNLEMANSAWKQVMGEAVRMSRFGEGTKGGKKKKHSLGSVMVRTTSQWPPSC